MPFDSVDFGDHFHVEEVEEVFEAVFQFCFELFVTWHDCRWLRLAQTLRS